MCLFFKHIDQGVVGLKNGGFPQTVKNKNSGAPPWPFLENKGSQASQKRGFAKDTPILWWLLYP